MSNEALTFEGILAEAGFYQRAEERAEKRIEEKYQKLLAKKDRDTARKMKARGRPVNEIAEDTGLSIEEIENL
ncbi:hypothetical protein AGMMS49546_02630 [Spirochaetia bacterium]|nr:hypothetical protein AGMMS49546_02630 [Spirochaetia bacterium]